MRVRMLERERDKTKRKGEGGGKGGEEDKPVPSSVASMEPLESLSKMAKAFLNCVAVCCSMLQCVAVCCSALQ